MADAVTPSQSTPQVDALPGVDPEPPRPNGRPGVHEREAGPRDPYRGVLILLFGIAVVAAWAGTNLGRLIYLKPLLDAAVTLELLAGILVGVLVALVGRAPRANEPPPSPEPPPATPRGRGAAVVAWARSAVVRAPRRVAGWIRHPAAPRFVRIVVALGGIAALVVDLRFPNFARVVSPVVAAWIVGACLLLAGLAATAARYMAELDPARLPEARGLARAARITAWVLVLTALAAVIRYASQDPRLVPLSPLTWVNAIHWILVAVNAAICANLLFARPPKVAPRAFPTDLGVFAALGARANPFASVLDAGERQLGIDLRSTWAVTVVRQSVEPLAIGLVVFGWLSTSFTVVGVQEEALIERLGVPVQGDPLASGLHLHLPWPIDRVYRIPTLRVQALAIGGEEEPASGPEDVLWSVLHVQNEFTLLLGDGRDLITIDGVVQFRIVDSRAWRYNTQNPAEALRALAYRAVMRNTVNLTLSDALSENVVLLTERMRKMVQEEADALGLGVEVVGLTMAGMHPPVAVAPAYEGVVSSQIKGVTAVVNAQAFKNEALPGAETEVINRRTAAHAQGSEQLARAAGEAWAFRTLLSQYQAAPAEYQFRRRLETLEQNLAGKQFTVVDFRFTRDGGELWIEP